MTPDLDPAKGAVEAYPLTWPEDRPRMPAWKRERSRFDVSMARARDEIVRNIELMCGKYGHMRTETNLIISTNMQLRRDGFPLSTQRKMDDPAVAVYFNYKKRPMCFACDRWDSIEDNMQAIAKTIDALRGIARWGTGDMMEAAFTGFTALPSPTQVALSNWRAVLSVDANEHNLQVVNDAYKRKRSQYHPDKGGDAATFHAINQAWAQAEQELT